jgi:hypothetical protein
MLKEKKQRFNKFFRLTEAEWEYAAHGGLQSGTILWGGPILKNDRGYLWLTLNQIVVGITVIVHQPS